MTNSPYPRPNQPLYSGDAFCVKCKSQPLLTEIEIEFKICGGCADVMASRYQEQKEWAEFHE